MLDSFRHNMKGIAFGIVILIAIVFAFSGIGSLSMSGSGADTAVIVNGEKVTELSVLRAISSEKRRILNENEGLDASLLEDCFPKRQNLVVWAYHLAPPANYSSEHRPFCQKMAVLIKISIFILFVLRVIPVVPF